MRRSAIAPMLLGAALALTGCTSGNLQFKVDHRMTIESPEARSEVSLPLTLSWSIEDFTVTGLDGAAADGQGLFAVFVDRAPMAAGADLTSLVGRDESCKRDPRCPNEEYLATRGVYVTPRTSLVLETLPKLDEGGSIEHHEVTIVLLNGNGERIGESAWYVPFTMRRDAA